MPTGSGPSIIHLVNQGRRGGESSSTSPVLLINPVFTITANNFVAACDAAASRKGCYPKIRQKSKSSGASPNRSPRKEQGLAPINVISMENVELEWEESVNEDPTFHSNPYLNFGSNSKLLQVPSSTTLFPAYDPICGDYYGESSGRQQRSSSITVPISHHSSRAPERSSSEVFIRRCSSASPKGRWGAAVGAVVDQSGHGVASPRIVASNGSSPRRRRMSAGAGNVTLSHSSPRSHYQHRRRRSSYKVKGGCGYSSSSSSSNTSVDNAAISPSPRRKPSLRPPTSAAAAATPTAAAAICQKRKVEEVVSGSSSGSYHDVVIIGSPNVGKSSLGEYFSKGGSSGSDQGIGSEEDGDSCDDEDLLGGKAIVYRPPLDQSQPKEVVIPFSLRIFTQQMSAVGHLYKYDAVIVLYSVTDRDSFSFARTALEQCRGGTGNGKNAPGPRAPIILVGNKSDLERSRVVSSLEGTSLATAYDVKFIEISSSLGVGVMELQKGLASQVLLKQRQRKGVLDGAGGSCSSISSTSTNGSNKSARGKGNLAQKLIDRILSLRVGSNQKSKSCLNLHSL